MGKPVSGKINLSKQLEHFEGLAEPRNIIYIKLVAPRHITDLMVNRMQPFQLDSLPSKELYKDVIVRLTHGKELTLNYFELKNKDVKIPLHTHPVEHLVIVLEGEMEFTFEDRKIVTKKNDCMFVPAKTQHTALVIDGPVKALEIYPAAEDEYYNR